MNSITVSPLVLQPYKSDQVLEIDPLDPLTFTVINGAKSGNLPKLLEAAPSLIQELSDIRKYTTEQRSFVYQRVLMLEGDVRAYNKELDDSFWIGVVRVILLVLTFGQFDYRASCKLQGPIGTEFGKIFGWGPFKKQYTVECFRALPKELQSRLASLLNLSEADEKKLKGEGRDADIANLLEDVDKVDSTLAEYLGEVEVERVPKPSLEGLLGVKRIEGAAWRSVALFVAGFSPEKLIEGLGLQNFKINASEEGKVCAESEKFAVLACYLTKEQWNALPKPLFFLFAPHFSGFTGYNVDGFEKAYYMTIREFQDLYFNHDPSLKNLLALGNNLYIAFDKVDDLSSQLPIANAICNLEASVLDQVIELLFLRDYANILPTLCSYISSQKVQELKPYSLAILYAEGRASAEFNEGVKKAFARFSAQQLIPVDQRMSSLLTEEQWKALPEATFLLCAKATSQSITRYPDSTAEHYGAQPVPELVPVKLLINNETFRQLYLERKLGVSILADLILGNNGGGLPLLQRLMPLEEGTGIALLAEILKLTPNQQFSPVIALLASLLTQEQIQQLDSTLCDMVTKCWPITGAPRVADSTFPAWLDRLIERKDGAALGLLIGGQQVVLATILNSKEASSIWALFTLIVTKSSLSVCWDSISIAKWKEMIDVVDQDTLIEFFRTARLDANKEGNKEKIAYAIAKLRTYELSIPMQKTILQNILQVVPRDQIGPVWGTFIREKIDHSLSDYWKELLRAPAILRF